jgi:hypothetical protein
LPAPVVPAMRPCGPSRTRSMSTDAVGGHADQRTRVGVVADGQPAGDDARRCERGVAVAAQQRGQREVVGNAGGDAERVLWVDQRTQGCCAGERTALADAGHAHRNGQKGRVRIGNPPADGAARQREHAGAQMRHPAVGRQHHQQSVSLRVGERPPQWAGPCCERARLVGEEQQVRGVIAQLGERSAEVALGDDGGRPAGQREVGEAAYAIPCGWAVGDDHAAQVGRAARCCQLHQQRPGDRVCVGSADGEAATRAEVGGQRQVECLGFAVGIVERCRCGPGNVAEAEAGGEGVGVRCSTRPQLRRPVADGLLCGGDSGYRRDVERPEPVAVAQRRCQVGATSEGVCVQRAAVPTACGQPLGPPAAYRDCRTEGAEQQEHRLLHHHCDRTGACQTDERGSNAAGRVMVGVGRCRRCEVGWLVRGKCARAADERAMNHLRSRRHRAVVVGTTARDRAVAHGEPNARLRRGRAGEWCAVHQHGCSSGELGEGQRTVGPHLQQRVVRLQGRVVAPHGGGVRSSHQVATHTQAMRATGVGPGVPRAQPAAHPGSRCGARRVAGVAGVGRLVRVEGAGGVGRLVEAAAEGVHHPY